MAHFARGTKTESCTLSLTGSSIPSKRAASMSDSSRRRMAVWACESKRADLKLVGSLTCSTFTFSSGGRNACGSRSEEHTSELQSHHDLVCRLLLEKKK